ncbi:hypothetical protein [Nitrosospira briensis]|uniref:hypothetical protein n=1 Tax=Nitrosospira briensis TaxID=35799 RepID=UPI0015A5E6D7|nr:hypothetical protein [Nitrosospira briensis]
MKPPPAAYHRKMIGVRKRGRKANPRLSSIMMGERAVLSINKKPDQPVHHLALD